MNDTTVLVTGATGLIGKALIGQLLMDESISVVALARDRDKAHRVLPIDNSRLHMYFGDIRSFQFADIAEDVDYIVHAASVTASRSFVEKPIETSMTSIEGAVNVLEYAATKSVKKIVYLSSMEVYGAPQTDEKITESNCCNIDTMETRASYPESKRMCESLCRAYYVEKGVPAVVLRLTQTFGPGVEYNDGRVFAEFARCALEGRDIILKTKGETKRSYLHVTDAVNAIIIALMNGKSGESYNVANESTYCSILEMAQIVALQCSYSNIEVKIAEDDISKAGYAPILKMNLDTRKMQSLGWRPKYNLHEMYVDMMAGMKYGKDA